MSIAAIVAHKMRSLLTMLGIIIGIASIVCVVAIGNGSQQKVLANISSLGTNTMDIFNGEGMGNRFSNRVKSLSITDVDILEKQSYNSTAMIYYKMAIDNENVWAMNNYALMLEKQGRLGEAENFFNMALQNGYVEALEHLIMMSRPQKRFEEADIDFSMAEEVEMVNAEN